MNNNLITAFMITQLFGCASNQKVTIENIQELNDAIIIYTTVGCFHHDRYELKVINNSLHVNQDSRGGFNFHGYSPEYIDLGTVFLDKEKLSGINNMFAILSTSEQYFCGTTNDEIEIRYTSLFGEKVFAKFSNSNCIDARNDSVYTLGNVIYDLKQERKLSRGYNR